MTRTATKPGRAKRPLDATPWQELSSGAGENLKKLSKKSKQPKNVAKDASGKPNKVIKKKDAESMEKQIKKIRKSESRRLKRMHFRNADKTCFNCRKKGHTLSECPEKNETVEGTGICFKCGSMNHISKFCKIKTKGKGAFPYATCFICKEMGHLSKDCPQNERGLYPNGGCCLECGSVRHLRKDCPEKQKKQGIGNFTLSTMKNSESIDADVEMGEEGEDVKPKQKKTPKSASSLNKRKTKVVTMK